MFDALKQARRAGSAARKARQDPNSQPEPQAPTPPVPTAKADSLSLPRSSKSLAKGSVSDQMRRLEQATAEISSQIGESRASGQPERKLTIGTGIRLKGDISDCDSLLVEGQIEASVNAQKVEIKENGAIMGDAEIGIADISGSFEGKLTVTERLIIRATGRVSGEIRYKAIEIEVGGEISGDIQAAGAKGGAKPRASSQKTQNAVSNEAGAHKETGTDG